MAIRGSLREASLPDVLQLLAMGKKTGCLSVTHRDNFGYVFFDRGRIAYASIVNRRDRLGDLLIQAGLLSDLLEAILDGQRDSRAVTLFRKYTQNLNLLGQARPRRAGGPA